jgi:hypothetical protein
MSGKLLIIYIWNFHVLNHFLLIYICKLHWNKIGGRCSCREYSEDTGNFRLIYICNFHVLSHLLLIYMCKLHWNWEGRARERMQSVWESGKWNRRWKFKTWFAKKVIFFWFTYVNFHVLSNLLLIYICILHWIQNMIRKKAARTRVKSLKKQRISEKAAIKIQAK